MIASPISAPGQAAIDSNPLLSNDLLELLQCPNCGTKLASFSDCHACGLKFNEEDGTPVLMPGEKAQTVSFKFSSDRSAIDTESLAKWLSFPPR